MGIRFGIDLGGSKIEIVALAQDGAQLLRRRAATPGGDYAATIAAITALVQDAERELGARGSVGIGIPGSEDPATSLIRNANSTCLNGRPLRRDLQDLLGRAVRLENDANCFALSEARDGAAAGATCVFGVILGTGVGAGVVINGALLSGVNRIAGEWGHNPLPGPEAILPACYCGRRGCVETFLSGPAFVRDHQAAGGADITPAEMAAAARSGDPVCEASLQRYEARLARALAVVINILDPEVIVLGGGLSNLDRLYENIPRIWGEHVFAPRVATRLARNRHGDSSGVLGAARL